MAATVDIAVLDAPFDPEAAHRAFRAAAPGAGAIVAFTGVVRGEADGAAVTALRLQHYPGFTEREIAAIVESARKRWPLTGAWVRHRVGDLAPGEPIVFVAAAAAHRRAAFAAADYIMDYLKSSAPFWKQEIRDGAAYWIEPRAEDYADRARWDEEKSAETNK